MREIGILGGTFDPFHNGHLSIARAAKDEYDLSEMILMPARISPFKLGKKVTNEEQRVEMLRLVASENPGFSVSVIEAESERVSYTYDTLTLLKNSYGDDVKLFFIIGTDSLLSMETWYKGKRLLREFQFIVGSRPGYKEEETLDRVDYYGDRYGTEVRLMTNDRVDISSTEIKNIIKSGGSITGLVPDCIERYIYEHGLYK